MLRARPTQLMARMTAHDASNCHQLRPWRALVGKAGWWWCEPPPRLTIAIGKLLVLWSPLRNGRRPQTWHTELMLQVTCCIKKIRTNPPHTAPETNPAHDRVHNPTSAPGSRTPSPTQKK